MTPMESTRIQSKQPIVPEPTYETEHTYRILARVNGKLVILHEGLTKSEARRAIGEGAKDTWVSGPALDERSE